MAWAVSKREHVATAVLAGLMAVVACLCWIWMLGLQGEAWSPDALAGDASAQLATGEIQAAVQSEQLTKQELQLAPSRVSAYARLAYARAIIDQGFTPRVQEALLTSYQQAPFSADLVIWRSRFIFSHWSDAMPPLRKAAAREVAAFARSNRFRRSLTPLAPEIADPAGRLAFALTLQNAQVDLD